MLGWNESQLFASAALKSTAVLGAAWLAATLLRGRSAAARHLVWTAAFAALLILPLLSMSLPALRLPSNPSFLPVGAIFQTNSSASSRSPALAPPAKAGAFSSVATRAWHPDWQLALILLWAAGAAAAFARMVIGWAALWRVRRAANPFAGLEIASAIRELGIRHPVDVLESQPGSMPMTFGVFHSAVFLPAEAAQWSMERRRVVLLHELAHVRRGDVTTHLLARIALCLYWWNPLAWFAWREFLKERERAADDLVLRAGACPSEYATHLLEIARSLQAVPGAAPAAVAMARSSQLEGRLRAILDSRANRQTPGRASACLAALLSLCIVVPLAALQAQSDALDATIRVASSQKNYPTLESAAKTAEESRQYDVARKLLESALAIRGEVSGEQSVSYQVGLIRLADLERRRGNQAEADTLYRKAISALGNRPEAAPALINLGVYAMANDYEQAVSYFQQARIADPAKRSQAAMWIAVIWARQGNTEEAESSFREASDTADPHSADAATVAELYGQFLQQNGRDADAKSQQERAAAARKEQVAQVMTAALAANSNVYRSGSGVTPPKLVYKIEPEYSEVARGALIQGTVVLYTEIGPDGLAHKIRVVAGLGLGLDEKAVEAVSQWKFQPGVKDGQPVTVAANIEVNWRLR